MASYTLEQCDAKIAYYEAIIEEAAGLTDDGNVGGTAYAGADGMDSRAQAQLKIWQQRRMIVLNGGQPVVLRRGYGGGGGC